jgi:hypothetical protein
MEEKTIFSEKRQIQVPQQPFQAPEFYRFGDSVGLVLGEQAGGTFCRVGEIGREPLHTAAGTQAFVHGTDPRR